MLAKIKQYKPVCYSPWSWWQNVKAQDAVWAGLKAAYPAVEAYSERQRGLFGTYLLYTGAVALVLLVVIWL